jgi:hypothetical protein
MVGVIGGSQASERVGRFRILARHKMGAAKVIPKALWK